MYRLKFLLVMLLLGSFSAGVYAQESKRENERYLKGAVPEENGKVVFSKSLAVPGKSMLQIQEKVQMWMQDRLNMNENKNSRVTFVDPLKGYVVGVGEEWLVFKSTAIVLDRAKMNYMLTAICREGGFDLRIEKIRFEYDDAKSTAEDWICDDYALNKEKNRILRPLVKWRVKVVDWADAIFADAVLKTGARSEVKDQKVQEATDKFQSVSLEELVKSPVLKESGKWVVAIGKDKKQQHLLVANAGGSLGEMDGMPVVFTIFSPDQDCSQLEDVQMYDVRFYRSGKNDPEYVIECRKVPMQQNMKGMPQTFVGKMKLAWKLKEDK